MIGKSRHGLFIAGAVSVIHGVLRNIAALPLQEPQLLATIAADSETSWPFNNMLVLALLMLLLVLLGGILSGTAPTPGHTSRYVIGLTIGLMALDETNLEILMKSGQPSDRKYAERIGPIRRDGYLLLCTLLLANTIVNETLPIVADRLLGGGLEAIVVSTLLLLIFAEILPQAVCTRFGLVIGGNLVWFVRILLWCLFPIAWPIARGLEWTLGKNERILYKRAELKELVSIMGEDQVTLTRDEVTMIRGVLDLKDKFPLNIMTPMDDVYMLNQEQVLDRDTIRQVFVGGYSRIPVYRDNRDNILGMILAKQLLMVDPEDKQAVSSIPISSIPLVATTTSLFDIINEFQQGRSHLAIVEAVDDTHKPLGIVTMEDIIEELIQEEIIDETDQYIDVRTKILVPRSLVAHAHLSHSQPHSRKSEALHIEKKHPQPTTSSRRSKSPTPTRELETACLKSPDKE